MVALIVDKKKFILKKKHLNPKNFTKCDVPYSIVGSCRVTIRGFQKLLKT